MSYRCSFYKMLTWLLLVAWVLPLSLRAQEQKRSFGLQEIIPGYYVYLHGDDRPGVSSTFNSGVIVTEDGVVVMDALGSEAIAQKVRKAISQLTHKPIRFLIISTPHKPFTGGLAVYADAYKIAHENTGEDLAKLLKADPEAVRKVKMPQQTFSRRTTLFLGGKEIRVMHLGRAHARGDTIVHIPEDRIVFMGETYYFNEFPYISQGYSAEWMRVLEDAEKLEADIFVPGHGFLPRDLGKTRAGLRDHWQILKDVRDAVKRQIERGASEEEALAAIHLPQFKKFKGYQRAFEIAVRRIYRELTVGLP